jgi:hypothetical protein
MTKFSLTPKSIILHAIRTRLKANGIEKLLLNFNILNDSYSVMLSSHPENGEVKNIKLDLDEDSINTIKKVFITKIGKAYTRNYDGDIKAVIIEIDCKKDTLDVFIETPEGKVNKFEYLT